MSAQAWSRLVLWVVLGASPVVAGAANAIAVGSELQNRTITLGDLQGGAGSDFNPELVFATTFTLQVTSDGPCIVSVQRTGTNWLTAGDLIVEIKTGNSFGSPLLVDTSDQTLLTSPGALVAEVYELRYKLRNVTVQNAARVYSANITYTVTDE